MKYYVIEIAEGDAKIKGKSIGEYETLDEAVCSFHKRLGVAMGSELYTSDLVMVVNSDGGVQKFEKYVAPIKEEVTE